MVHLSRMILIIFLFSWMAMSCDKLNLEMDVPGCVEEKINEIKTEEVRNPPAEVWEWTIDGKAYYYITAACCDQFNSLYDGNCNIVCAPDGGLTGTGDGNCPDFDGEIAKELIWKDDRK